MTQPKKPNSRRNLDLANVLPTADKAVEWANALVAKIDAAK